MTEQKVVNAYILVAVLKGAAAPKKVAEGLTWAKLKEQAKKDASKFDSMRAVESWKDPDGTTHFKAWDLSLDANGEVSYKSAYNFTDVALASAADAAADVAVI